MELALYNAVPGIDADCGGGCACGTCHVIIEDKWFKQSGKILETESQMLDMTPERLHSRLSCQIKVTDAMDGIWKGSLTRISNVISVNLQIIRLRRFKGV